MKPNELKIYYGGGLNEELDEALCTCVKPFGYQQWASGQTMVGPRVRDLAFDNEWLGLLSTAERAKVVRGPLEAPSVPDYPVALTRASDAFWMQKAYEVANEESTCLSHKCGVVVVLGSVQLVSAANGVAPGERLCSEVGCARLGVASGDNLHWCRAAHAEGAAIAIAAATQAGIKGSTMFTTRWPCIFCWVLIALAGIKLLVYAEPYPGPEGGPPFKPPASVQVRRWIPATE